MMKFLISIPIVCIFLLTTWGQEDDSEQSSLFEGRLKVKGRLKDKCRHLKPNREEYDRCKRSNGTDVSGVLETGNDTNVTLNLETTQGILPSTISVKDLNATQSNDTITGGTFNGTSEAHLNFTSEFTKISNESSTTESVLTNISLSVQLSSSSISPSTVSILLTTVSITNQSTLAPSTSLQNSTSSANLVNSTLLTTTSVVANETTSTLSNVSLISSTISLRPISVNNLNLSNENDNETNSQTPAELKKIEKEIDEANKGEEPLTVFDGQKLKKCGNTVHPISKILNWMKKTNASQEYKDSKCEVNYHDACADTWRSCALRGPQIFCSKTCSPTSCPTLVNFGYETNDQPFYTIDGCADNPRFSCKYLRERGDCLALATSITKFCAKTCNYCAQSREFLPFMPEQHKLTLWLHKFEKGKYADYAKYIWNQLDLIQNKILSGKCTTKT